MDCSSDLIAAKATPEAVSAISLVRLTGRGASRIVESIMGLPEGRLRGMRRSVGDFDGLDHLVAISWPEGRSYTGEEMVDLMCHGSPGTATAVLNRLLEAGARQAEPGEFTRRAWLNGRLTEMDVLTLSARFRSLECTDNAKDLRDRLGILIMRTEAMIEFEEEHGIEAEDPIEDLLKQAILTAEEAAEITGRIEVLPRVFIMGPVNSGKSTLFNRLCGETAAIVSDTPGTTRDGAERTVDVRGRAVRICDTAGTGGDELDGMALDIAVATRRKGDRILWLDPAMEDPPGSIIAEHPSMKLASLCDISGTQTLPGWHRLSTLQGTGLSAIEEFITAPEGGSPARRVWRAADLLKDALSACEGNDMALAAEILRMATDELNTTERGSLAVERALEVFCVGK